MARIRRLAVLVGAVALTGAFVAGPAQADSPEVFSGSAAGTALDLAVLGKQATFGASTAKVNSAGVATGTGAGHLVVTGATTGVSAVDSALSTNSKLTADAPSGQTVSQGPSCVTPPLVAPVADILTVGLACASAKADNTNQPSAFGEGSVADADVHIETLVKTVEDAVNGAQTTAQVQLGDELADILDTVCTTAGTAETAEGPVCDATTKLSDLVSSVLKTQTVDIELGKSTSSVATAPASVTSEASAAGATIKILPTPQIDGVTSGEPMVTITVGDAQAKTGYNRDTGAASAAADPAIVRIKFNQVLVEGLTLPEVTVVQNEDPTKTTVTTTPKQFPNEIVVAPTTLTELAAKLSAASGQNSDTLISVCEDGAAVCILPGTPLESRIWLASGHTKVNPDGTATATADAVRVDLLVRLAQDLAAADVTGTTDGILTDPGIHLALAHAEAAVGGRQASITPTCTSNCDKKTNQELPRSGDEPPLELPRTGGIPWMPMLGAAGLALAVLFRRATLKATR